MLLETLIRQVDWTTELLRDHKWEIRKAMLERTTEIVQGAPRGSLEGASVLMKLEVLAYELLETVVAVRREEYGALNGGCGEAREGEGDHATPPCNERKRVRAAHENVDDFVGKAASATLGSLIDHDGSSSATADAGALRTAGTRGGTAAASATTMSSTWTKSSTANARLRASSIVALNDDLMHHIISFAVGKAGLRSMTRLACVSRGWYNAIHGAHELWMHICHHCLPFTMPHEEDDGAERSGVPVVVKGLLRSAGGYRGVLMQHREAVWKHDQLRRAQEAERTSNGEKVPGRGGRERPQVLMEVTWFEHMTIIIEVFDRVSGQCMLSMIGRGELANGRDSDDEPDALVLAVDAKSVWRKAFRVEEMVAPWDTPWWSEFDEDVHVNTSRYFQQRGRFIARVLGVKRGGGMVVLYAPGPNAEFDFNRGVLPLAEDAVHLWVTRSSDMLCAHQMGFPLAASLCMYVRHDSDGVSRIEYASGGLEPSLYFELTPTEGDTVGGAGTTFGASHFCTAADYLYAALS